MSHFSGGKDSILSRFVICDRLVMTSGALLMSVWVLVSLKIADVRQHSTDEHRSACFLVFTLNWFPVHALTYANGCGVPVGSTWAR